jgi:hypothetical protein
MSHKSLIVYASLTGNTEKVAQRFHKVFIEKGWECDLLKVTKKTDVFNSAFDYTQYDFVCAGSYVHGSLPADFLINYLRSNQNNVRYTPDMMKMKDMPEPDEDELVKRLAGDFNPHPQPEGSRRTEPPRAIFNYRDKKGVVFVTFGGEHQGYKEALPSLDLLESELEHTRYQCIGRFCCPGRFGTTRGWFRNLPERPNEKDLMRAEIFMEEIIDELEWVYFRE